MAQPIKGRLGGSVLGYDLELEMHGSILDGRIGGEIIGKDVHLNFLDG